ncbi:MAG TPA: septation ring formation regulator EzrA [Bacillota bacterium]|nr:septation ring formation regulator EzrA [Bacillota bacterium]
MAAYIIGIILLIIVIIIAGLILRKRVYDTVDRLESWKMDITNRNTASQIAQIKRLNLTGETQKQFESWKDRWEYIVTKELPDIEEYLFDAEAGADRYRFKKAKQILAKAEETLNSIENDLENMLTELDELLESEKTSREEIEELQPTIKGLRQTLAKKRYQYGNSDVRLEKSLDEFDHQLDVYHEFVDDGNYFEAKRVADELKENLSVFRDEMDEIPDILNSCVEDVPAQLDEIMAGIKEMKEDGYQVEQLGFEKEIRDYKRRLKDCVKSIEKTGIIDAQQIIAEIEERISEIYLELEKEAIAKTYIETQYPNYENELEQLERNFQETKNEVDDLKQAYYIEDNDMEQFLLLEKSINMLTNQLEEVLHSIENEDTTHTFIREQIEDGFSQIEELKENQERFKQTIQNLRSDEIAAKEKVLEMKKQINNLNRKLKKSNVPGVPSTIWNLMEESIHKNNNVLDMLEQKPLDITGVQQSLKDAKSTLDYFSEQTNRMLEQAYLTERVIQYANRYRSNFPELAANLRESERLFRSCEYELALEKAAESVEEIEPGALKRLEAYHDDMENEFA